MMSFSGVCGVAVFAASPLSVDNLSSSAALREDVVMLSFSFSEPSVVAVPLGGTGLTRTLILNGDMKVKVMEPNISRSSKPMHAKIISSLVMSTSGDNNKFSVIVDLEHLLIFDESDELNGNRQRVLEFKF